MTRKNSSLRSLSYILRNETYEGLTKGDHVEVVGEIGSWSFLYHCTNTDTGSEWLDVYGGVPGTETVRAFHADRVKAVGPRYRPRQRRSPRTAVAVALEELI